MAAIAARPQDPPRGGHRPCCDSVAGTAAPRQPGTLAGPGSGCQLRLSESAVGASVLPVGLTRLYYGNAGAACSQDMSPLTIIRGADLSLAHWHRGPLPASRCLGNSG